MDTPAKWPALQTWTLPALLKLELSWNQITPQTPEEHAAHDASMAELRQLIAQRATPRPKETYDDDGDEEPCL